MNPNKNIIDLTLPLEENPPYFSRHPAKTFEKDGWNASTLHIYSHAGTHMDAPVHFNVNNTSIDRMEPGQLIVPCHLIRLPNPEPKSLIGPEQLTAIESLFREGEGLLIQTGWSRYYADRETYRNQLPRISKAFAQWCAERKVRMLGVEPPSIADVNNIDEIQEIHRILLRANVTIVEGLTNLNSIATSPVTVIALPLKIKGGDGAPARVIAIEH